jgi:hypothetical protein
MVGDCMNYVVERLSAIAKGETRKLSCGTLLIDRVKFSEPSQTAYRHAIYAGLDDAQILEIESLIERHLPAELKEVFRHSNGGYIFSTSFSWRGLRLTADALNEGWLPVSIEYGNVMSRPVEKVGRKVRFADSSTQVRFGIYREYGVEVMMNAFDDPQVYAVPKGAAGPELFRWPNLESFFVSEVDRMCDLFSLADSTDTTVILPPPWL